MLEVVKAIIFREDKFLLQLRDNNPTISYPNYWSFFGGGLEKEEDHSEGLIRELEEELSWHPIEFNFLMKVRNELDDCNISYYLVECTVPDKQLCLGEGQAKAWFSIEEIFILLNTEWHL